jgi:hypothetical protein
MRSGFPRASGCIAGAQGVLAGDGNTDSRRLDSDLVVHGSSRAARRFGRFATMVPT